MFSFKSSQVSAKKAKDAQRIVKAQRIVLREEPQRRTKRVTINHVKVEGAPNHKK